MKCAWAAAFAAVVSVSGVSMEAHAQRAPRRYAIVVGNNTGVGSEQPLRYAERDARRFGDVLVEFGGVPNGRVVRLYDARAEELDAAFVALAERIEQDAAELGDAETTLILYYSGHAAADGLHMRGTNMSMRRLRELTADAPADLRVLVLDACNSGVVTRVKGAEPVESIPIRLMEGTRSEGLAILTSSTADEKAQESDRLKGSYFTHNLLTGLRGAADESGDGRVSLSEVYQYAYDETLRATTRAEFVQHPTYSFELKGRQDLVLTRLDTTASSYGQLELGREGFYVLFEKNVDGDIVAELHAEQGTRLTIEEGTYLVRRRDGSSRVSQAEVRVVAGRSVALEESDYSRVAKAKVLRKGEVVGASSYLGVGAGYGSSVSPIEGFSLSPRLELGFEFPAWSLLVGATYTARDVDTTFLRLSETHVGVDLTPHRVFDIGDGSFALGPRFALGYVAQSVDGGLAAPRQSLVPSVGVMARAAWQLDSRWAVFIEPTASAAILNATQGQMGAGLEWRGIVHVNAGLTFSLF